jgi:hypothetical protein
MKIPSFVFCLLLGSIVHAQENYEIQVYSSPTQTKNSTIFELHSNFTFKGEKQIINKVLPSYHAIHETVEITTGIADNFELGLYLFVNNTPSHGFQIVGTHIRPRVTAPLRWKLPVGLSLSAEIGYQQATFSEEVWNMEIRPIIDKTWNKFYASLNPTLGISLQGISNKHTPVFEPNLKLSYQFFKTTSLGFEYYGSTGYINNFETIINQEHALYAVYDLTGNAKWELNIGAGVGLTQATDKLVGKVLVGRRINWK